MRYLSVCSGIEAVSYAWESLGLEPVGFAEIEPFASAVLAHRFPGVKNHGDFTQLDARPGDFDILVGGTPCQSFSVAGLRGGIEDARGNLALEFFRLAARAKPKWIVWENVPGVLSSGKGQDFGAILGAMAELGYGWAYRILDAKFFGVPQRRRRVFLVGHLGDWRRAAAVLFEPESLRRDHSPRSQAREEIAGMLDGGSGSRGRSSDTERMTFVPAVSPALKARDYKGPSSDGDGDGAPLVVHLLTTNCGSATEDGTGRGAPLVAHTLSGGPGFDASEDGTGRGVPLIPVAFDPVQITHPENRSRLAPGKACHTLYKENVSRASVFFSVVPEGWQGADLRATEIDVAPAITVTEFQKKTDRGVRVVQQLGVRRLTPVERERLQGFPDNWTNVPYKGKPAKDGPRYAVIGNSMAVPVMRFIGERIIRVENTP